MTTGLANQVKQMAWVQVRQWNVQGVLEEGQVDDISLELRVFEN